MTILVYRDRTLAADSLACADTQRIGAVRKLFRSPDGRIGGACGSEERIQAFGSWIERGLPDGAFDPDCTVKGWFLGLLVSPDGTVISIDSAGLVLTEPSEWIAYGTNPGMTAARGAFLMGADARQAVDCAIRADIECGGPVQLQQLSPGP